MYTFPLVGISKRYRNNINKSYPIIQVNDIRMCITYIPRNACNSTFPVEVLPVCSHRTTKDSNVKLTTTGNSWYPFPIKDSTRLLHVRVNCATNSNKNEKVWYTGTACESMYTITRSVLNVIQSVLVVYQHTR